ncbi:DUF554 domain-containing protein [Carboxydothermus ferrireducens]|uniref:DUF554 domain-containing protein n=1 Tax=Carboxydothermus ferrireducens DSM 11255 TaxID=1119529 RepID=A0ABX2RDT3_9THEO|nr:DUF554 domain-containing protein [Carboxydothermus ferrireducens]NYE58015.1 hypothetical protein [Carboxydothermus ferrireducens DSM 11255]
MLGTIVNFIAILLGGSIGVFFKKSLPENYKEIVMNILALSVVVVGIQMAITSKNFLVVILSLVLGGLVGEFLGIEKGLNSLGQKLEKRFSESGGDFARGFVYATLVFCVGAMAIMGAIEDGLNNNHQILFIKSLLDGISSIIFAATLGKGVIFSAFPVLIYQGSISLFAGLIKGFLTPAIVNELTATGGILIIGIGTNMLNLTKLKIGNYLPALIFVFVFEPALRFLS